MGSEMFIRDRVKIRPRKRKLPRQVDLALRLPPESPRVGRILPLEVPEQPEPPPGLVQELPREQHRVPLRSRRRS